MRQQKFDDAWREAFEGGEQSPSVNVWASLESKLAAMEGVAMKRRVIFYQRLAAACALFAVAIGSLTSYYFNTKEANERTRLTEQKAGFPEKEGNQDQGSTEVNDQIENEKFLSIGIDNGKGESNTGVEAKRKNKITRPTQVAEGVNQRLASVNNESQNQGVFEFDRVNTSSDKYRNRTSATLTIKDILFVEPKVSGTVKDVAIVRILPAMPASMMATSRRDKRTTENFWASVGAAAGNYQPQVGSGTIAQADALQSAPGFSAVSNTTAASNVASQGTSYSVGLNLAKKVSPRWLLLGGVSYLNQAIDYTSNFASVDQSNKVSAYTNDYATSGKSSTITFTSPYELNSVNQFISVPVQAGFLLVDRKVGLQINSGVATNI
ncbi:MAG: hypothetical protein JNL53_15625, partial [Cyclobacteriaceae bacterium]|nr:hypothetical protein [Cyclobacteriaceae bacterium]